MLRYAFVTRGPGGGDHIFPAFVLDDWGREIRTLKLYQCFLRELELYARLPCYAYPVEEQSVIKGILLDAILLPDAAAVDPQQIA